MKWNKIDDTAPFSEARKTFPPPFTEVFLICKRENVTHEYFVAYVNNYLQWYVKFVYESIEIDTRLLVPILWSPIQGPEGKKINTRNITPNDLMKRLELINATLKK
jgi:hypothetical protein